MSKHDDKVYLSHILASIDKVHQFVGDISFDSFRQNDMRIDAVTRNFEIIGEASNNISPEFKSYHPEINFRPIISMRNWLIHGYDAVDLEVVWKTIKKDLPELKKHIKKILGNS